MPQQTASIVPHFEQLPEALYLLIRQSSWPLVQLPQCTMQEYLALQTWVGKLDIRTPRPQAVMHEHSPD